MGCVTYFEFSIWAPSRISLANITAVRKSVPWKLDLYVVFQICNTLFLPSPAIPENETTYLVEKERLSGPE